MKTVRFLVAVFTLGITPLIFFSCFLDIPAGLRTQAYGVVIDSTSGAPMQGVKVIIFGVSSYQNVAVTTTDADGKFTMRFVTDGTANAYCIYVESPLSYYQNQEYLFRNYGKQIIAGKPNRDLKLNSRVFQQTALKLELLIAPDTIGPVPISFSIVGQVPSPFVYLSSVYTPGFDAALSASVADTTLFGNIYRHVDQYIQLSLYDTALKSNRTWRAPVFTAKKDSLTMTIEVPRPSTWPGY